VTRSEFINEMESALAGLPHSEVSRITEYYDEIFNEALDDGKTEEEICEGLDKPEDIAGRVRAEIAFVRAEQEPTAKTMSTVLVVVLGIFALPVGLPIAIAIFAVLLALTVTVFAVVVSLGATALALFAGGIVGIVSGFVAIIQGLPLFGISFIGASFTLVGLSILGAIALFYIFRAMFRGIVRCCRTLYRWVVNRDGRRVQK